MKKVFKEIMNGSSKDMKDIFQIKIIDTDKETFITYYQTSNLGFPFGKKFTQNIKDMGYIDTKDCIKKLKHRKLLTNEVDYEEQLESEKIGYINLGIDRIKRHGEINTKHFEDVIENLKEYGLGYCDAQNIIIGGYLNEVQSNC